MQINIFTYNNLRDPLSFVCANRTEIKIEKFISLYHVSSTNFSQWTIYLLAFGIVCGAEDRVSWRERERDGIWVGCFKFFYLKCVQFKCFSQRKSQSYHQLVSSASHHFQILFSLFFPISLCLNKDLKRPRNMNIIFMVFDRAPSFNSVSFNFSNRFFID